MEEYLRNVKNLRSQMNDFEEEEANISVEEQKQRTAIQTMEDDLGSVILETKSLKEETNEMMKANGQICCQILQKQKKISLLEIESSTLSQTLELLQKEKASLHEKLKENSFYYNKVQEDLDVKLQDQQEWVKSNKLNTMSDIGSVEESVNEQMDYNEGKQSSEMLSTEVEVRDMGDETKERCKDLIAQLRSGKSKLEELTVKNSELSLKNNESKKLVEQLKHKIESLSPELKSMEKKILEEEHKALLADKEGEIEYLQSLQIRIEQLQGISEEVKCQCGQTYIVELRGVGTSQALH